MPEVGFEPAFPVFEREKTVHTLARGHCDRLLNSLGTQNIFNLVSVVIR
jgi:hypothetical protein